MKFLLDLIVFVMILGVFGTMFDLARELRNETAKTHERGIISLKAWTKKLTQ